MAIRKSSLTSPPPRPELDRLIEQSRQTVITDDELREQQVSFVYGNAPIDSRTTKESARRAVMNFGMRLEDLQRTGGDG